MIVCVCKSVSNKRIRSLIDAGADFEDLQMELGVSLCCGKCEPFVRDMLDEAPCGNVRACAATVPATHARPVLFHERKAA